MILMKQQDFYEMLIKIAEMTFLIAFSLNLPILFDLSGVICGKELAICSTCRVIRLIRNSTYPGYFLYIKLTKTKGNENIYEIGGVRVNR